MNENLIEITGMTKVYGEDEAAVYALAGVDVQVHRGELLPPTALCWTCFVNTQILATFLEVSRCNS